MIPIATAPNNIEKKPPNTQAMDETQIKSNVDLSNMDPSRPVTEKIKKASVEMEITADNTAIFLPPDVFLRLKGILISDSHTGQNIYGESGAHFGISIFISQTGQNP